MSRPIPLRPDPGALVTRNVTAVARVVIAKAVARTERRSDDTAILRGRWPDDPIAPLVLRAASQPSLLATDTALGQSVVADLIATIGPVSAGARLLQSGLQLVFENNYTIYVPGLGRPPMRFRLSRKARQSRCIVLLARQWRWCRTSSRALSR